MSKLDQAFIKAYTKGAGAGHGTATDSQPLTTEQLYADPLRHRLDGSHPSAQAHALPAPGTAPYAAFIGPPEDSFQDAPPLVTPMVDADFGTRQDGPAMGPRTIPATPMPGPIAGGYPSAGYMPIASQGIAPAPGPTPAASVTSPDVRPGTPPVASPWASDEARQTLLSAAALKLPPSLELPHVFSATGEAATAEPPSESAPQPFAPDCEVDHFVWPEVCQLLLKREAPYFRHVGQRLKAATQEQHHLVLVTSSRRGEGRTTLALCLARCAAQAGVRVALVDADLKNPQIAVRLGMEAPRGWFDVALGQAPLNEAAVASVGDDFTLFPLAAVDDAIAADDPRLLGVLKQIAAQFPLVIVDAGPLDSESQQVFANGGGLVVSAAIVVRDQRLTTEKKARATAEQLQQAGLPAVGIAENFGTSAQP